MIDPKEIDAIRARDAALGDVAPNWLKPAARDRRTLLSALDAAQASQKERELRLIKFVRCRGTEEYNDCANDDLLAAFDAQEKANG